MTTKRGAKATIRDVAAAAEVSVAAVSAALNGKGSLKAETRERIQREAERLGYRPSRVAQAFREGRIGAIALVLPLMDSVDEQQRLIGLDYYMAIAAGSASAAFAAGYSLTLTPPLSSREQWRMVRADGVVLCDPVADDERLTVLDEIGVPVVTIDRDPTREPMPPYAAGDNYANMRLLLDHLDDEGARRIALLSADSSWAWTQDGDRAYAEWCAEHGHEPLRVPVPLGKGDNDALEATVELLQRAAPPDAVIASAEQYTAGVVNACRKLGRRIPDDVMVAVGVDSRSALQNDPPLTAIDLHPHQQGEAAVRLLLDRLAHDAARPDPVIVPSTLHRRASTHRG
ncbi:LacI family DNA-binding transcriptional regulator [Nocardioides ginsengisoli]|uniref:LacI family DNA-binding transcriptional regulator n=1 Tax=Nocardioides ginsengisoli TaxID=363868 RepID=A0ABW3W6K1_9ACTN